MPKIRYSLFWHLMLCLFQYGIVLDAGSSHTSMYIYKWPADKQNGTGIVTQHSECHAKGERGGQPAAGMEALPERSCSGQKDISP